MILDFGLEMRQDSSFLAITAGATEGSEGVYAEPIVFGHVIMPGINSIEYDQDKDVVLPKMKLLADYVNEHQEFLRLPSRIQKPISKPTSM